MQYRSALVIFRKPTRPSLPLRKAPPLISVFSPQGRRGKPPSGARNRYALRLVGHQSPRHVCAGWDRLDATGDTTSTAFDVVQKELKYLGLWKFAGAVMYVLHETLGLSEENMIAPIDEKRGKLLLAEILNGGNFGKHFTKYGLFTQQGMAKKYFLKIWRNMHFVQYYPAEALSEPIFRTWHFFWWMWNKKYKLDYQRKNQLS